MLRQLSGHLAATEAATSAATRARQQAVALRLADDVRLVRASWSPESRAPRTPMAEEALRRFHTLGHQRLDDIAAVLRSY